MKLGQHPAIQPILAGVLETNMAYLRNFTASHGVAREEVDEVINRAYLDIYRIRPKKDIAAQLRKLEGSSNSEDCNKKLRDSLTALFVCYLKFKCCDYHKGKQRQNRFSSLEHEIERGALPLLISEDRNIYHLLLEIGLSPVDMDHLIKGSEQRRDDALSKFCEFLAEKAGLNRQEHDFLIFRVNNPKAHDQEFNLILEPYEVSRIKQSTLHKIVVFFDMA